mmetsp:Transcript_31908/g.69683  ORF Transcript_31908/g.69683 Transcript_31908/m.69683 type:complete len:160 (+) Transcript_31908:76-555(+)
MQRLQPTVLWAQRQHAVLLTVQLVDCPDPVIQLLPEGRLDFQGVKQENNTYGFDMDLFGQIVPEESKIAKTLRSIFLVIKKSEEGHWPRLLKGKGKPPKYVSVDWDKWVDEDEEQDEVNDTIMNLPLESLQQHPRQTDISNEEDDALSDLADLEPGPYD